MEPRECFRLPRISSGRLTRPGQSIRFEFGPGSSSVAAIRALSADRLDIGLSSQVVGDNERALGLRTIEIAKSAVVFGIHGSLGVSGLRTQQVCDIYQRKTKSWKEVGGPDLAILPLTRPPHESDPKIVREQISCFKETEGVAVLESAGDMAKVLAGRSGAIGMTNTTVVESSQGAIKALALNGVVSNPENLQSGAYPLARQFFFVVKGSPTGAVADFLAFVKSPQGQRVIRDNKASPVK